MRNNMTKLKRHRLYAFIILVITLIADQISKLMAEDFIPHSPEKIVVIPGILDFQYLENRGAAFGMLADHRWVFMIATVLFLAVAIYAVFAMKARHPLINYALMLIISGGIGNMIDRIFRGYVIDFINFSFVHFFVFNIADCCVVIGCVLFVIYLIFDIKHDKTERENAGTANGERQHNTDRSRR